MTTTLLRIVMILAAVLVLPKAARSGEAHWPETLTLGTGSPGGTYYDYGEGLARLLTRKLDLPVFTRSTEGPTENIKLLEAKRTELEKAAGAKLAHAQEQATKIEGLKIQVTQKAGVDGRLFGSVTNVDIVEALDALGHTVEKSMVRMPDGPLKHVGEFPLVVALHTDVSAHIVVAVLGDTTTPAAG